MSVGQHDIQGAYVSVVTIGACEHRHSLATLTHLSTIEYPCCMSHALLDLAWAYFALSEAETPRKATLPLLRGPFNIARLTSIAGTHEGLHLTRTRNGGVEQEGCVPRDRGLMPKLLRLHYLSSYCTPTFSGRAPKRTTGRPQYVPSAYCIGRQPRALRNIGSVCLLDRQGYRQGPEPKTGQQKNISKTLIFRRSHRLAHPRADIP